jgi:superfamily II DNA/RNA helicase
MTPNQRSAAHQAFQRDDAEVMVATVAFGMGIDKPNIRTIIHYGVAGSLEAYYQQAGRAGGWGRLQLFVMDQGCWSWGGCCSDLQPGCCSCCQHAA